jgi:membrane protein
MLPDKLNTRLTEIYEKANRRTGGVLGVVRETAESFTRERGAEAAASIAYYTVFSIIPLLLLLTSLLGFLLKNSSALEQVLNLVESIFPYARQPVENLLTSVVANRTSTGLIGLIALAFGATGVFLSLVRNINRAWAGARPRNLVVGYLLSLGTIGLIALLLIGWVIISTLANLLIQLNLLGLQDIAFFQSTTWTLVSYLVWVFVFILFLFLYRWVPNLRVKWSEAFWGALGVTLGLLIVSKVFSWFLSSGLATYDTLYGALGTALALLTWVYISSIIILVGAHLSAAVARFKRPGDFLAKETS